MRALRITFGIVIVLAIAVWDFGVPHHTSKSAAAAKSGASVAKGVPAVPPAPVVASLASTADVFRPAPAAKPEFKATFTGSSLDTSVWGTCYPEPNLHFGNGCTNFGNPGEREWYRPSQVKVFGGVLHLVAQHEATPGRTKSGAPQTYECRSGMVTSYRSFDFEYGFVQVEAKIPEGSGLWPGLWLSASNFDFPPEMDLLEAWGGGAKFYAAGYFHFQTPKGPEQIVGDITTPGTRAFGWHTFGLSWTKNQITWLLDGKVIMKTRKHIPHQKMYFIADLAEYTTKARPNVTKGQCSGTLEIRSVQVWKA